MYWGVVYKNIPGLAKKACIYWGARGYESGDIREGRYELRYIKKRIKEEEEERERSLY